MIELKTILKICFTCILLGIFTLPYMLAGKPSKHRITFFIKRNDSSKIMSENGQITLCLRNKSGKNYFAIKKSGLFVYASKSPTTDSLCEGHKGYDYFLAKNHLRINENTSYIFNTNKETCFKINIYDKCSFRNKGKYIFKIMIALAEYKEELKLMQSIIDYKEYRARYVDYMSKVDIFPINTESFVYEVARTASYKQPESTPPTYKNASAGNY